MADLAEDTDVPEELAMTVQLGGSTSVCVSPDGQYLATGLCNGVLAIVDMDTLSVIRSCRGHDGAINSVVWCEDTSIMTAGEDGWCSKWNEYDLEVAGLLNVGTPIKHLAYGGASSFAALGRDGNVLIGNFAETEVMVIETTAKATSLAWLSTESGKALLCGNSKGNIDVFLGTVLVKSIKICNAAVRQVIAGETLIIVNAGDRKVRATTHPGAPLWEVETLSVFEDTISRTQISAVTLSSNGAHIFAVAKGKDPKTYLWSTLFGICLKEYEPAPENIGTVTFFGSNEAKVVGVGEQTGAIYIWSNKLRDNWASLLPDFTQMLDVESYKEREDDFDVYDDHITDPTFKSPVDIWGTSENTARSCLVRVDLR